jgi:glycosyltransferase involved in cell wall biosynthesis
LHNQTGLLFEPNNAEALSLALEELILDKEKRNRFGEKGHQRTIEYFSLENHIKKFEAIFEKI